MVRNHTNQDLFDHEEITITRTCLKNHSRNLHAPRCGRFCRKSFSNTLWFVTGKQDLVKMWFDISEGGYYTIIFNRKKFRKGVCGSQKELRG